ncbi:MAG TPA: sugar phosphate isomerase/epimerase family protein [Vicinamibacteria bacterium]|nr:sugar phosphate isomerase/epimerase family protein [Vicinamibacteria bacterium]
MPERSSPPPSSLTRRAFLAATGAGAAALSAPRSLLAAGATPASRVSFNTANLVGRVSGYRYQLSQWMDQHNKTIAATDEAAWRAICKEIAAAGFKAVDVWEAHAAPESLDEAKARTWKRVLDESGLTPVSYAGGLRQETLRICQWLGIPHIDGGLHDNTPERATALCREHGIRFNVENHPEKSADEILAKVGGGNEWLGVCIDMGWLGTQGVSGPAVIKACGSLVRHTHVKDVKAARKHETCLLGEGSADVAGCLAALRELKYAGWYSWEDEPENRNPFDSAARNREWIEKRVSG